MGWKVWIQGRVKNRGHFGKLLPLMRRPGMCEGLKIKENTWSLGNSKLFHRIRAENDTEVLRKEMTSVIRSSQSNFVMYRNIKSLCGTTGTYIVL